MYFSIFPRFSYYMLTCLFTTLITGNIGVTSYRNVINVFVDCNHLSLKVHIRGPGSLGARFGTSHLAEHRQCLHKNIRNQQSMILHRPHNLKTVKACFYTSDS
ncbi:protein E19A [Elephant endotheliotropic herpesvirus 6]|nr:protein E19A [Elephant endotheliotropic herpesvirus 6]